MTPKPIDEILTSRISKISYIPHTESHEDYTPISLPRICKHFSANFLTSASCNGSSLEDVSSPSPKFARGVAGRAGSHTTGSLIDEDTS